MSLTARLEVRLTDAEKAVWGAAAVHAGLSLSEYVRTRVNEGVTLQAKLPPAVTSPVPEPVTDAPPPALAPAKLQYPLCHQCAPIGTPSCDLCRFLNSVR